VILLSDYDIAILTPEVIESVLSRAVALNKPVVVDAHDQFSRFYGIHSATPNQPEAEAELGQSLADDDALTAGAARLVDRMGGKAVLITRGGLGMALYERGQGTHFIPVATYSEVRDATGAGDTAATVYALALGSGATPLEAAHLANLAAGVAVCKSGVATVSAPELREAVRAWKPR
jgi:D-beta-D-heptose 7-phosphate kinase/D-beta-D-heptose 1-phosphate adenosyltransferase